MAALLHAMTAKSSLADSDEFALADSAAAYGPKKTLWSTIKSVIKTALSIGGSHALSEDNIGDGVSYKRISAAKADKINGGTYSEDDIVNGSSYHRVQAAQADAINGGTFDAASVSAAGVNSFVSSYHDDLNLLVKGGMAFAYDDSSHDRHFPTPDLGIANVLVIPGPSSGYCRQIVFDYNDPIMYIRHCDSGIWGAWAQVWTSGSDGNGGAAPLAKGITGSTNCPNNTATTIATLAANEMSARPDVYLVAVGTSSHSIAEATTLGFVMTYNGDMTYASIKTATNTSVSVNGHDVQVTQTEGATEVRYWRISKFN
jgi:hypothetical protein